MSDTVIEIRDLSKLYRLGQVGTGTLSHDLNRWWARIRGKEDPYTQVGQVNRRDQISQSDYAWALRDINFDVKRGEILGIIGANGAGKSTLLKLISRITAPTTGHIRAKGRIASLLEVGTGMHPEMTARENIYLNGAIMGMTRTEITAKFDDIIDFAGCQMYVDTPIKRYSSGMKVRLGFAVAAFLEPEIMIVDEVLAVGDAEFQAKCLGKLQDVAGGGRTVLFVSHNMGAVRGLCERGILLREGTNVSDGPVEQVLDDYVGYANQNGGIREDDPNRSGTGAARLTECLLLDRNRTPIASAVAGMPTILQLKYRTSETLRFLDVTMTFYDNKGAAVTNLSTKHYNALLRHPGHTGEIECNIPQLPLLPGRYRVAIALQFGGTNLDQVSNAMTLDVSSSVFFPTGRVPDSRYCACMVAHEWGHRPTINSGEVDGFLRIPSQPNVPTT